MNAGLGVRAIMGTRILIIKRVGAVLATGVEER